MSNLDVIVGFEQARHMVGNDGKNMSRRMSQLYPHGNVAPGLNLHYESCDELDVTKTW